MAKLLVYHDLLWWITIRMRQNQRALSLLHYLVFVMFHASSALAQELSDEVLEQWLESGDQAPPYEKQGGSEALKFIYPPPDKPLPASHTLLELTEVSIESGWVNVEQCHTELDPVPDAEVIYQFRQMRNLRVTEAKGIEQFWIEGQSVQLKNIGRGARLCLSLEAQILNQTDSGDYRLHYGPFQRRFLDSYFPMHVSLKVDYSRTLLTYGAIMPVVTEGFSVVQEGKRIAIDAWFRGKLTIALEFHTESRP